MVCGQFASRDVDIITGYVDAVEDALTIPVAEEAQLQADGLLVMIGATVDNAYHERLQQLIVNPENIHEVAEDFRMVYTPLHGTGNRSEEHTSELQSRFDLVCRLLLGKKIKN